MNLFSPMAGQDALSILFQGSISYPQIMAWFKFGVFRGGKVRRVGHALRTGSLGWPVRQFFRVGYDEPA